MISSKAARKELVNIDPERIVDPEKLWGDMERSLVNYGMPVTNLYDELYHQEFKFVRKREIKIYLPAAHDPKFALFVSACFGKFPDSSIGNIFLKKYKSVFNAEKVKIDHQNFFEMIQNLFSSPLGIGSHNLTTQRTSWSLGPTIFVLDATRSEDLFDFWNLRALGWSIIPMPIQWFSELVGTCIDFIRKNHVPLKGNPHGVMHETTVLCSRTIGDHGFGQVKEAFGENAPKGFHYGNYPRIWDNWARDKDHATRCLVVCEESRGESELMEGELSTPIIQPAFSTSNLKSHGPAWANAILLSEAYGDKNVPLTFLRSFGSLDTFLIAPPEIARPDSQEGLVTCVNEYHTHAYFRNFDSVRMFQKWFKGKQIDLHVSIPGRTAMEIIRRLGGLRLSNLVADCDVIEALNRMAMGLNEEIIDEGKEKKKIAKKSMHRAQFLGLLQKVNENHETRAKNHLKRLLDAKAIQLGILVECPMCTSRSWYSLNKLDDEVLCEHCLESYVFPSADPPEKNWHYRVLGPFSTENYARGSYSAILALNHLVNTIRGSSTWVPSMESRGKDAFEFDFALWKEESDRGIKKQLAVFGECKTYDEFKVKDIKKMRKLAETFPGSSLVFATLKQELKKREIERISKLAYWGRKHIGEGQTRAPVLILTRRELCEDMPIPYSWKDGTVKMKKFAKHPHHIHGLRQMCWPHFILAIFAAGLLSVWGGYISSQRKTLESLSVSQVAVLGSLIGIHFSMHSLIVSLISLGVAFFVVRNIKSNRRVESSSLHMTIYVILLSLCLFLIQWSPHLKAHFVPSFLGDISLMSKTDVIEAAATILVLLVVSWIWRIQILRRSFELNLLGRELSSPLHLLRILVIIFSVEYFGLLFTLGFLFIPTTLIQSKADRSWRTHQIHCVLVASAAILVGFPLVMSLPSIQTTPTLVLTMALISLTVPIAKQLHLLRG